MNEAKIDDGGPAYPCPDNNWADGKSLRDWFAGQALAGWMAVPLNGQPITQEIIENDARLCYQYADAMLKARQT